MDIGLTEDEGQSGLEEDDDAFSGLTSTLTGEELWPGDDESDESDVDDEEMSRRLLPLRKARRKPIVLLEVSDIESMRGSEAPGLDEQSLEDDITSLWSEALTLSSKKQKKRRTLSPEVYLSLILNVPGLFDRVYSFLRSEDVFMHRRVCRSFQRRYSKYQIKVCVDSCIPSFVRHTAGLKTPMAPTLRFRIDGQVTQEGLALLGHVVSTNRVPGLEDIATRTREDVDSRLFVSFFKACEGAPPDCRIQTLDFSGCYLGDDCVRVLLRAMRKGTFPALQALRLPRCNLTFLSVRCLTETLVIRATLHPPSGKRHPPRCTPLLELDISRNELAEGVHHLFPPPTAAPLHSSLTRLDLSEAGLEPSDMTPIADNLRRLSLRSLTHLRLRDNPHLGDASLAALLSALTPPRPNNPRQPHATIPDDRTHASGGSGKSGRTPDDSGHLIAAHLIHLDLSSTNLGIASARALAHAMEGGALDELQHLDVSFNLLAHDGAALLCDALVQHRCPKLANLNLACNRLKDAGVHALAHCLATECCPSLTSIDISVNEISGSIQNLARVLNDRVCPRLQRLVLCGNIFELHVIIQLFAPTLRRTVRFE